VGTATHEQQLTTPHSLCRKMEGQNIVHVIDSVLMPEGYDMYQDYYDSITRCAQLTRGCRRGGRGR